MYIVHFFSLLFRIMFIFRFLVNKQDFAAALFHDLFLFSSFSHVLHGKKQTQAEMETQIQYDTDFFQVFCLKAGQLILLTDKEHADTHVIT